MLNSINPYCVQMNTLQRVSFQAGKKSVKEIAEYFGEVVSRKKRPVEEKFDFMARYLENSGWEAYKKLSEALYLEANHKNPIPKIADKKIAKKFGEILIASNKTPALMLLDMADTMKRFAREKYKGLTNAMKQEAHRMSQRTEQRNILGL